MTPSFRWFAIPGVRYPRWVLAGAALLLVVTAALSSQLSVDSSRHTMVSADNPHQALQMAFFERFGLPDELVLVVSGGTPQQRGLAVDSLENGLRDVAELNGRILARVDERTMAEVLFVQRSLRPPEGLDEDGHLQSGDGERLFVLLFPDVPGTQQAHEVRPVVEAVRAVRDRVMADPALAAVTADLTGAPAMVVDEEVEIQRGIATTSAATGLMIIGILWLAFRSLKLALLALTPVVLGILCTMAIASLVFGELNMVTSSASSILLGLGIDFGVYLLSRFREQRLSGDTVADAILNSTQLSGVALLMGSLTTALAFLTTAVTEFTAYARLGVLIAIGLLCMMATTLVVLPALLRVTQREGSVQGGPASSASPGFRLWHSARVPLVVAGVVWTAFAAAGLPQLTFNTRFYDFIPEHVEGARALLAIENDPAATPLRAVVPVRGIEPARELTDRLRALPEVQAVFSPTDALPPLNLSRLQARIALEPDATSTDEFRRAWTTASNIVARGGYAPGDLPPVLQHQFVSLDQSEVALQVVPAGNIWDPQVAARFAQAVQTVAPDATGMAMHVHAHLRFIREGFTTAAALAAGLIFVLLLGMFRRVADAVLAFLPCVAGLVCTLGLMGWVGIPLDAANIVVLPLLLGIGVDAGIHLVDRARHEGGAPGSFGPWMRGTGRAVLLAGLTTMAGFAALMLADYGAMVSLGLVMTLGIACVLVHSLLVLPAALLLLKRVSL